MLAQGRAQRMSADGSSPSLYFLNVGDDDWQAGDIRDRDHDKRKEN
ncbi:hypothetical protein [Sphingobium sp. Sx8-8]|nr:hypothetical protein [Sphingobium sp. Sx8-8]